MDEDYGRRRGLLALLLALFGALQAWLLLAPGALLVSQMEADVLHILDGVFRIRDGQIQHVDFRTPLGVLAFNALAIPVKAGFGPGVAMALANIAAMALTIPATLWLHATRLAFWPALGLGISAMLVASALIWGGGDIGASFAMFYNRWGWALLLVTLPVMLVPGRGRADDLIDGVIIGLVAAALFYLKITYAVGLAVIGLAWLLTLRRWRAVGVALLGCAVALSAITAAFGGIEMLGGYMDDMADVSANTFRPRPGPGLLQVVTHPETIAIALALFVGALAIFRAGFAAQAVLWIVAGGAIYYIAYQNWGNWPTGALAAPFILWALARRAPEAAQAFGAPARTVMNVVAIGLIFAFAPTLALMQSSLVASIQAHPSTSTALLAGHGAPDLVFEDAEGRFFGLDRVGEGAEDDPQRREFAGVVFPPCALGPGAQAVYSPLAERLAASLDLSGKRLLLADPVNPLWYLTGTPPLRGVHIWHYTELGERLEEVDILVAPFCALTRPQRNAILDEVSDSGLAFELAFETPHFAVFERRR